MQSPVSFRTAVGLGVTETAPVPLASDPSLATDKGQVSALFLLDLSAAVNTIDHVSLMTRPRRSDRNGQGGVLRTPFLPSWQCSWKDPGISL